MKELLELANTKGFTKWFEDYAELQHGLKGWLDTDTYLDEVELPTELYLTLIQTFLRTKNIEVRVWAEYYSDGINWCCQALKWNLALKAEDFIEHGTFQYGDNNEYPTYELALEKGIHEGLKFI